jgi:hypothetical protein
VLDFLKLAGIWACPRVRGYSRIAVSGVVSGPWRDAGAGAGTDFSTRIRVYKVNIRADFTCCHLYCRPPRFIWYVDTLPSRSNVSLLQCLRFVHCFAVIEVKIWKTFNFSLEVDLKDNQGDKQSALVFAIPYIRVSSILFSQNIVAC